MSFNGWHLFWVTGSSTSLLMGATSKTSPCSVVRGTTRIHLRSFVILIYINCVCLVPLSEGAMISMYADDIILCKTIHHPENYDDLQRHWCHPWMLHMHLSFNTQPNKMQISNCIKEEATSSPTHWSGHWQWYPGADWLLPLLGCFGNIKNILGWPHWTYMLRLVGMLYRQFYAWADTSTMLRIYVTCICPHLEYACQLWDPYTTKKFACKVCLKQWDMNYESMLEQLDLTPLSRRKL